MTRDLTLAPDLAELALAGAKTETRRPVRPGRECQHEAGTTYDLRTRPGDPVLGRVRVTSVHQEPLGAITATGARADGHPDRPSFVERWVQTYGAWVDTQPVWVIRFEVVR